ncbi:peptidase [Hallella bergensis]|uniref:peptidase n=1 Tax=Hallella bergensis TaxID=242750 RepID=UPI003990A230
MMKKQTLLSLLLFLVCMMWASSVSAYVMIRWVSYTKTGYITGEGITGSVHYDAENKVLTLDNAHITFDNPVLENGDDGLKLVVKGDCSLTCEANGRNAITPNYPMTITGGGTLTIESRGAAIQPDTNDPITLTIEGCTVVAHGSNYGFVGRRNSTLVIRNATVKAQGTQDGSIYQWGDIKLEGCKIEQPADATIGNDPNGKCVKKDGKAVTSEVVIVPDGTGVASLTTDVPTPTSGVYTLDGVYLGTHVESLPRGVYIVGGKKVIKN